MRVIEEYFNDKNPLLLRHARICGFSDHTVLLLERHNSKSVLPTYRQFTKKNLSAYDYLTTVITDTKKSILFVQLFDLTACTPNMLLNGINRQIRSDGSTKIKASRANPLLINRFTRHGKKERALSGYAKALSVIMALYKSTRHGALFGYKHGSHINKFVDTRIIDLEFYLKVLIFNYRADYAFDDANLTKTVPELFYSNLSLASSELLQRNLLIVGPAYSVKISRIPKKRYKNMRNKTSRYEARNIMIPAKAVPAYWRSFLKHAWNFSFERTYQAKFVDVILTATLLPGKTIGYRLAKKTYFKEKHV